MLPYLTADLPGIGGVLRASPEDFRVDEIPAYPATGAGEHVFIRIEKRGLTTPHATKAIAAALGIKDRDIGVAGMKDRHAVTTQWLSLPPPITPEAALALVVENVQVHEAIRHPHKLRTGHARGNRFVLRVTDLACDVDTAVTRARAVLEQLALAPGAPNFFGEQRFGRDGDNAARGRELIASAHRGEPRRRADHRLDRLMMSALQSELFNAWLVERLADGCYRDAIAGDVMHKVGGGLFDCIDAAVDGPRVRAGEVIPTGPMFGVTTRVPPAGTAEAEREQRILDASGLTRTSFDAVRAIAEGTRRDAAIKVADVAVTPGAGTEGRGGWIEVRFGLPGGAYATVVMREVMKVPEA